MELDEMIDLKEKFQDLYDNTGIISVEGDGILVKADYLFNQFDYVKVKKREIDDNTYPYEASAIYEGTKFHAVFSEKEYEYYKQEGFIDGELKGQKTRG